MIRISSRKGSRRGRKHPEDTVGDTRPRSVSPGGRHRPRARDFAGFVAAAYGGFLELPVPVVLFVLWLSGVSLLGAVSVAVYSTGAWLVSVLAG